MLRDKLIDYSILSKACKHYSDKGYEQIEVPWIVPDYVAASTFTGEVDTSYHFSDGMALVGSAEQGFVKLMLDDKLEVNKKYFSVSPCFRGDTPDRTHSNWFMKLELFAVVDELRFGSHSLEDRFIMDALALFKNVGLTGGNGVGLFSSCTEIGFDVMARIGNERGAEELELGSYGVREIDGKYLVYGTGVALPRLSLALELHKELQNGRLP